MVTNAAAQGGSSEAELRGLSDGSRTFIAAIAWFAWMILFGKGTDYLEKYPKWDLLGGLHTWGWIGIVIAVILGYGIATMLAVLTYRLLGRFDRRAAAGS